MTDLDKTEFRYRIRDAYHLITTGQQPALAPDELDVKDAIEEFQKMEADKDKKAEDLRKKLKEIKDKENDDLYKIAQAEAEAIAKSEAQKADIIKKAEDDMAKVEADAAKASQAAKTASTPSNQTTQHKKG